MNPGAQGTERVRLRTLDKIARLLEPFGPDICRQMLGMLVTTYGAEGEVVRAYERARKSEHRLSRTQMALVPDRPPPHMSGTNGDISGTDVRDIAPVFLASTASVVRASKAKGLHELLRIYEELFTCKYGERPLISSGKDPKLLSRILKLYGPEKTEELLAEFFETDDEFVLKAGHTIGVFSSVVNKLIGERAKRNESPPDLGQPIAWGAPGCLLQLWNQEAPGDCTAIDSSPGLLTLERQALRRFPDREWWAGVFRQLPQSPYLLGKVKPQPGRPGRTRAIDIAWLLGVTPEGVEHAFQIYHGHYLRTP